MVFWGWGNGVWGRWLCVACVSLGGFADSGDALVCFGLLCSARLFLLFNGMVGFDQSGSSDGVFPRECRSLVGVVAEVLDSGGQKCRADCWIYMYEDEDEDENAGVYILQAKLLVFRTSWRMVKYVP